MTQSATVASRVVFSDGGVDPGTATAAGFTNAASPVVIGLVLPILLFLMIDPLVLLNAPFLITTILSPLLMFSVAVYTYCVMNPGHIVAVVADGQARIVELVQVNFFATRRTAIPYHDISSVRLASAYDQDGYGVQQAELVLTSGEHATLPVVTTAAEVQALKSAIGLK